MTSVVLKDALVILDPWDLHPVSAFRASLGSINGTPCVCKAISSSRSNYNGTFSESSPFCPAYVQWVSLISSNNRFYLLIYEATWVILLVSNIVRAFDVPMLIFALVVRLGIGLMNSEDSWISPWVIISLLHEDPSTPRVEYKLFK